MEMTMIRIGRRRHLGRNAQVIPAHCIPGPSGWDLFRPTQLVPTPAGQDSVSDREAGILFRAMPFMRPTRVSQQVPVSGGFEHRKIRDHGFSAETGSWKDHRQDQHYR